MKSDDSRGRDLRGARPRRGPILFAGAAIVVAAGVTAFTLLGNQPAGSLLGFRGDPEPGDRTSAGAEAPGGGSALDGAAAGARSLQGRSASGDPSDASRSGGGGTGSLVGSTSPDSRGVRSTSLVARDAFTRDLETFAETPEAEDSGSDTERVREIGGVRAVSLSKAPRRSELPPDMPEEVAVPEDSSVDQGRQLPEGGGFVKMTVGLPPEGARQFFVESLRQDGYQLRYNRLTQTGFEMSGIGPDGIVKVLGNRSSDGTIILMSNEPK